MKIIVCIFLWLITSVAAKAQYDYFDMPTTAALIDHNKQNYSDHQELRSNQLASAATVSLWKKSTNKMKNLIDAIDKRVTSFFIIAADISTTINIYKQLDELLAYQKQALVLAFKYPWLVVWAEKTEALIISDATDLVAFITLMVMSYGALNKISVGDRKQLYNELSHQLAKIVGDARFLVDKLKAIDLAETFKNTPGWRSINNDKKMVEDILRSFKF